MDSNIRYLISGDSSLIIEFGNEINEKLNNMVRSLMLYIEQKNIKGVVEVIPAYRSLMINYNPLIISYQNLVQVLKEAEKNTDLINYIKSDIIEIPVLYGGDRGPDICFVANHNKLTVDDVIKIHSSREYLIYMLGFTPGFPYLGGMDERIAAPRLKTPRTKIQGGSVGIAASQTGIYPIDSPGGWQIIGRTPLRLYQPHRHSPILLRAGNYIKFVSIDEKEYQKINNEINKESYRHVVYPRRAGV